MHNPDVKWNEQPDQKTGCSRAWDIIITTEGPSQQVLSSIEIPQDAFRLISPADFIFFQSIATNFMSLTTGSSIRD